MTKRKMIIGLIFFLLPNENGRQIRMEAKQGSLNKVNIPTTDQTTNGETDERTDMRVHRAGRFTSNNVHI